MSFSDLVTAVCRQTGLNLQFGKTDSCALEYEIGLEMIISNVDHGQSVLLFQPLHRMTGGDEAGLMRRCMELNAYGAGTNGLALGHDPDTGWIVLSQRLSLRDMDAERLANAIANFMPTAINLIGTLVDANQAPAAQADASLPADAIRA